MPSPRIDRPTITERVAALVKRYPGRSTKDLSGFASAEGMGGRSFTNGLRHASATGRVESTGTGAGTRWFPAGSVAAAPPTAAPRMVAGRGERREDCVRYAECLDVAAREHPNGACCPKACAGYAPRDLKADLVRVASCRTGGGLAGAA